MAVETKKEKSPFNKEGMFNEATPKIFELAKELRKNMTDAEKLLWGYLKAGINGLKFRRQHPIGIYIADFYCHKIKLIIELDGSIHDNEEVKKRDEVREDDLRKWGYTILRIRNKALFTGIDKILFTIKTKVEELISRADKNFETEKSSL
jgi:very-short-patch-repair endonuclease